jgi:hypothetical protein
MYNYVYMLPPHKTSNSNFYFFESHTYIVYIYIVGRTTKWRTKYDKSSCTIMCTCVHVYMLPPPHKTSNSNFYFFESHTYTHTYYNIYIVGRTTKWRTKYDKSSCTFLEFCVSHTCVQLCVHATTTTQNFKFKFLFF